MSNMHMTQNSSIWEVETGEGKFTVFFPCAVFNEEDKFMFIPRAIRDFEFVPTPKEARKEEQDRIANLNYSALLKKLKEAICFGTNTSQGIISLSWDKKEVYVM